MRCRRTKAPSASLATTLLSIRECSVEVPSSFSYEKNGDIIRIPIAQQGCITISGCELKRYNTRGILKTEILEHGSQGPKLSKGCTLQLLNPKAIDGQDYDALKGIVDLYSTELPAMSFAANTGKESPFLKKCVISGKYCSLALRRINCGEVLAAITYQILAPDTQYAEIPLAAVRKSHQHQGIGSFLFNELRKRLHDIGVLTVFCWGDEESEGFWTKQGFIKVAKVNGLGKMCKLPIKADIRRAMSIPGNATLLVCKLHHSKIAALTNINSFVDHITEQAKFPALEGINEPDLQFIKASPAIGTATPIATEIKHSVQNTPSFLEKEKGSLISTSNKGIEPLNTDVAEKGLSTGEFEKRILKEVSNPLSSQSQAGARKSIQPMFEGMVVGQCTRLPNRSEIEKENIQCTMSGQRLRKRGRQPSSLDNVPFIGPKKPGAMQHVVMFMNMVDDKRRVQLTNFVEKLGGCVTNDGASSTHVITREARRTLNFCIALNSGAWVLSPAWLKASVKQDNFVEETPYVLKDESFEKKYKTSICDSIVRARKHLNGLLKGMFFYATPHVQPAIEMLTPIIMSAGGKVLLSLEQVQDPSHTVVVVCEDDIGEAFFAAKLGFATYSSEWLMGCIMKQELDLSTTQFTESL